MRHLLRSLALIGIVWAAVVSFPATASAASACCTSCSRQLTWCDANCPTCNCWGNYLACAGSCGTPACPT